MNIRSLIALVAVASFLSLGSCTTVKPTGTVNFNMTPQEKQVASEVSARAANAVVSVGLAKANDYTENLNPYVHSVAKALYEQQGQIFTAADMEKIAKDYGDPAQPQKFKALGKNLWNIAKREAGPVAFNLVLQYLGYGAQTGGAPVQK